MYRLLFAIFATALLTACGSVSSETHEKYTDIPEISVTMDARGIPDAAEDQPLFIEVNKDGKNVDTADVSVEVWNAAEDPSTSTTYSATRREDGIYVAPIDIEMTGLYLAKAHVSTGEIKATPLQYFMVGHLSANEFDLLEELVPGENNAVGGHH
ncbi:FixH family protein [Salinicoccus sp. ID82-1]|uniref:YtkA-like domain-containing protein n=1 Tax=Salinicoccus cyprini TaxID=2493691 RepID=A0A558ARU7_9STAP|nr:MULTISPECIES: FixH family protein [Salinicoccus]MCG1009521.1 FixH family protein [Salinicoccus sp. ID82-1]TVT26956.1 hypothetical protein FO441_10675 [Salinicoccus cyprini]